MILLGLSAIGIGFMLGYSYCALIEYIENELDD